MQKFFIECFFVFCTIKIKLRFKCPQLSFEGQDDSIFVETRMESTRLSLLLFFSFIRLIGYLFCSDFISGGRKSIEVKGICILQYLAKTCAYLEFDIGKESCWFTKNKIKGKVFFFLQCMTTSFLVPKIYVFTNQTRFLSIRNTFIIVKVTQLYIYSIEVLLNSFPQHFINVLYITV